MESHTGSLIIKKQRILIKILFIITAIVNVFFIDNIMRGVFFSLATIIVLSIDFNLIITWLKLLLRILPLYSSIILMGILFDLPLLKQLLLIMKISNLLLISVYLINAFDINRLLDKAPPRNTLLRFLLETLFYIKKILDRFGEISSTSKISDSSSSLLSTITHAVNEVKESNVAYNKPISFQENVELSLTSGSKIFLINLYGFSMISIQILSAILVKLCHVI